MGNRPLPSTSYERNWGAFRITVIYLVIGVLWILFSDQLAAAVATDPATFTTLSILKGWGYVILTALLLYWLIRRHTAALRASEGQLRLVTDALPVLISYIDTGQRYRFNNRAYEEWFGSSPAEIIGKTVEQVLGPAAYQVISEHIQAALAGQQVSFESAMPYQDGGSRFVQATYIPDIAPDGQVKGFFALVSDISARIQAETALRLSEQKFANAFRISPDSININRLSDGLFIDINEEFTSVTGYTRQEVIGKSSLDLKLWANPADRARLVQGLQDQGEVTGLEAVFRIKDGTLHIGQMSARRIEVGGEACILSIMHDITDRKRVEAALRESEQRLREIIDNASGIIWVKDLSGRFLTVNRTHEKLFGLTQEETIGKTVFDIHPPDLAEAYTENDRQVLDSGRAMEFEESVVFQNEKRTFIAVKFPLRDGNGRVYALGAICTDITERKRAEEELRQTAVELARSNAELEQFAYVASHDLQEPLRAVAGMAQLLQRHYQGRLDEQADIYIGHAVEGVTRMQTLINDLLTFSRVGRQGRTFEPTQAAAALKTALANLSIAIRESGAVVKHDSLPVVMADPTQLTQVFQNLIGNAIKFHSEQPPAIQVGAERMPGEWRFAVRDNGIGIAPQYFERIFIVFQRLHTRREYPGTGIGLALCKKIVERHGGRIWVDSQPGQGSTFYFTIPSKE